MVAMVGFRVSIGLSIWLNVFEAATCDQHISWFDFRFLDWTHFWVWFSNMGLIFVLDERMLDRRWGWLYDWFGNGIMSCTQLKIIRWSTPSGIDKDRPRTLYLPTCTSWNKQQHKSPHLVILVWISRHHRRRFKCGQIRVGFFWWRRLNGEGKGYSSGSSWIYSSIRWGRERWGSDLGVRVFFNLKIINNIKKFKK